MINTRTGFLFKVCETYRNTKNYARNFYNILSLRRRNVRVPFSSFVGSNTSIGSGTIINGPAFIASDENGSVTIGRYCAVAYGLRIRPRNHYYGYANLQDKFQNRYMFPELGSYKGPVNIGNNVWIADNVIILSGVSIGHGAILGAGAIVTKDIPPYAVAAGNPAKILKYRFSKEIIDQLLEIKWWDWEQDKIKRNKIFFSTDFSKHADMDLYNLIVD